MTKKNIYKEAEKLYVQNLSEKLKFSVDLDLLILKGEDITLTFISFNKLKYFLQQTHWATFGKQYENSSNK